MSKCIYRFSDCHAMKKAAIPIDGIRGLCGINGCGKSTLSKWLYDIVNGANEYDKCRMVDGQWDYGNTMKPGARS